MRTLGFLGIAALLPFNAIGFVIAFQSSDWRGIGLMLLMAGLLAAFAVTLWRGRKLEREPNARRRLADGWSGESVSAFLTNQVAKAPEGKVLIAGCVVSLVLAVLALTSPSVIGLPADRGSQNAVLFGMWPVLAFVAYVRICGPTFRASIFNTLAMLCVFAVPPIIAYR